MKALCAARLYRRRANHHPTCGRPPTSGGVPRATYCRRMYSFEARPPPRAQCRTGGELWISLIVPGMVNREDVADGAIPGVSPQRPIRAPKPGCEGQGLTNDNQQGKQNANLHQRIHAAHGATDRIQLDAAASTAQGLAEGAPQEGTLQAEPGNQGEVGAAYFFFVRRSRFVDVFTFARCFTIATSLLTSSGSWSLGNSLSCMNPSKLVMMCPAVNMAVK